MRQKNHPQKGFANMIVLIIFLLTMGGTVWYFKKFPLTQTRLGEPVEQYKTGDVKKDILAPIEENNKNATTTQKTHTSSVKTYHDEEYGFSFEYPLSFKLKIEQPFSKYGGTYPQKIIQIIPSYESSYNIKLTIRAGVPKKGDATICLNKEVVIGKQKKIVTEVSCGDAGYHGRTYTLSLADKMVLEISQGVQGEDEPTTENDIKGILDSFEFSK